MVIVHNLVMITAFICKWADIAQRGVPTTTIIEPFNAKENICHGFLASQIGSLMNQLPFQAAKETFHYRIIVAIPCPTHLSFIKWGR